MIRTQQSRVPWAWVVLLTTTTGVFAFVDQCSENALTFTMKKFVSDPALITFLGSLNVAFSFLVAPYAAWKSDRIWTKWGRRKVFMLPAWALLVITLVITPFAPNIWWLTIAIVLYQFAVDFGYVGPWSPLFYEVVPLHQRGRGTVIKRLMTISAMLLFHYVLIGKFDTAYRWHLLGLDLKVTGEQLIYFVAAGLVLGAMLNVGLNVKEVEPAQRLCSERFSPWKCLQGIVSNQQWRLLYLLTFCSIALTAGLGQLNALLVTEQFGYSKALMGKMQSVALVLEVLVGMPVLALIVDRFDRFRIFQVGLMLSTAQSLVYWAFVKFVAHNGIPSEHTIILYTVSHSLMNVMAGLALEPLFYDYVPRSQMGTLSSGLLFVRGAMRLLVLNGVGLWVKGYSSLVGAGARYDYMSGYLYVFLVAVLGCAVSIYFDVQRRRGRLIEYGKLEEKGDAVAEDLAVNAPPAVVDGV